MSSERLERNRLSELAVDHLLGELSAADAVEYRALRERYPDFNDAALEQSVAALTVAGGQEFEPLPERLRVRIATDATAYFGAEWRAAEVPTPATTPRSARPEPPREDWVRFGGWLAAAACLLVAVLSWTTRPAPVSVQARTPPAQGPASVVAPEESRPAERQIAQPPATNTVRVAEVAAVPVEPDPEAARAQLLASRRPVLHRAWRSGGDPTGLHVSGDVVWDPATQTGYMRFAGLPRNDPNVAQYQLWIFDGTRDDRYPIDGGVFNITGAREGEVVAIHAKLKVAVPLMFAITIERPGGVVVSDRSRLAALANTT
jgi:hypothetical protein